MIAARAISIIFMLLVFFSCSGGNTVFRDRLLTLKDGSVVILSGGQLYRITEGGTAVTQLGGEGFLSMALGDGFLLTGGRDGRVHRRRLADIDKRGKLLFSMDEPVILVAPLSNGLVAVSTAGITRLRSVTTKEADGIRTSLSTAAASAAGRTAWLGSDGFHLAAPGALSGQKLAEGALSFAFCGEDLYWTGADRKVHYLKPDHSTGILRDFYPPDNSPLLSLGSSPDGRYLFGITDPVKGRSLFMSLDRQEGKIFMAPAPEGTTAAAISRDNKVRYYLAGNTLHVYGFQQEQRGMLQRIPLREE